METKNMFKALAMVMLMPAMLLTTACSNDDFAVNDNTEIVNQKGFELPVTVNVTRQGDDATMRATYTDNGNGTGSLGFSSGDKLLVKGKQFAGILTWQSGGTFSGTITTQNTSYTGTADDLFKNAMFISAYLLPAGYDSKGFIKVSGSGYQMGISYDWTKAFALTKAEAVEQLSRENAGSYSSGTGFALEPLGFILNFTITGLTPSTEVAVAFTNGTITTSGNVTTDGSGNATFAISTNSANIGSCTLTVGGNNIALPSTSLDAGKIYNITRAVTPPTLAQTMTNAGMTVKVKYYYENGENYCLFSSNGDGSYTFQSGYGYAGGDNNMAKALVVENGKLVFKQNFFNPIDNNWSNYGFSVTFYSDNSYSQWIPDTEYGSKNHNPSFISVEVNSVPIALIQKITVSDLVKAEGQFWSEIINNNSDKIKADNGYVLRISDNAKLQYNPGGDVWQDVYTHNDYQSMFTYKFEGD